jgi:hypothetical protein
MEEGRRLQRFTSMAKDPVRLHRAIMVPMSGQGQSVPAIASMLQVSADYVRDGVGDHVVTPHNDSRRGEPGGPDGPSTDSQQPGTVPAAIWHRAPADSMTHPR